MTAPPRPRAARPARSLTVPLAAVGLVAVLVTAACGGDEALPAPSRTAATGVPTSLLDAVPEPGQAQPAGTVEFAGATADGRYGVAVLVDGDGNLVAYVCDGVHHGELFTSQMADAPAVLSLAGAAGGRLVLDLTGELPAGTMTRSGAELAFALEPADAVGGFYRRVRGGTLEAWVVTPAGRSRG